MEKLPPFQHTSDTSRIAAETLTTAHKYREQLIQLLGKRGIEGCTIDEFAQHQGVPPNAVSGRFSELVGDNKICKTPRRRKTRSGKPAVVYVLGSWTDHMLPPSNIPAPPKEPSLLEKYKEAQRHHGHGHVIKRHDGQTNGCGGPSLCKICRQAKSYFEYMQNREAQ